MKFMQVLSGSLLILILLLIRKLGFYKLPKTVFKTGWVIVAVFFLLPMEQLLPLWQGWVRPIAEKQSAVWEPLAAVQTFSQEMSQTLYSFEPVQTQPESLPQGSLPILPTILWLGTLVCLLYFAVTWFRWMRRFRFSIPAEGQLLTNWMTAHGLRRPLKVRTMDGISTALTYGVLRPKILIPSQWWAEKEPALEYVLEHEYQHIKSYDNLMKFLFTAVLCLNWYHPLIWCMYVLAGKDVELSCDEKVIGIFGVSRRGDYARTLFENKTTSELFSLFSGYGKRTMGKRVTVIMKYKMISKKLGYVFIGISVILGLSLFCLAAIASQPDESSKPFFPLTSVQLITKDNRYMIGRVAPIGVGGGRVHNAEDVEYNNGVVTYKNDDSKPYEIPKNRFVQSIVSDVPLMPSSITEVIVKGNKIPEMMIPNNAVAVLAKKDGTGWLCNKGDKIEFTYEQYPFEGVTGQSIDIGYIKDGVMYEYETIKTRGEGQYQFTAPEDGEYFIYLIGSSSDHISYKVGTIQVVE